MREPIRPSDFVAANPAPLDLEKFARDVVFVYERWKRYKEQEFCAACDAPLTPEDKSQATAHDFHFVCLKHRQYAQQFKLYKIREEVGAPEFKGYWE